MTSTLAVCSHLPGTWKRHWCLITLSAQWPAYENGAKTVLQLIRNNITLINDGQSRIDYRIYI